MFCEVTNALNGLFGSLTSSIVKLELLARIEFFKFIHSLAPSEFGYLAIAFSHTSFAEFLYHLYSSPCNGLYKLAFCKYQFAIL